MGWREKKSLRAFGNLDALDNLVVYGPSCLFEEFVPLDTKIDDLCPLNREGDEFFHDIVHDIPSRLRNPVTMVRAPVLAVTVVRGILYIL